jgi:stringent starvation protein B
MTFSMMSLLPPKKDVALALLERASVFVHLDPRSDQVCVPPWLKRQPQLVLQIGLNLAVNIPDLTVEDDAVSCTLSFSRRPHFCRVPWAAVYALVGEDGRGMVWPSDIPAEVAAQTQTGKALDTPAGRAAPLARSPSLVALDGAKSRKSKPTVAAAEAQRADSPHGAAAPLAGAPHAVTPHAATPHAATPATSRAGIQRPASQRSHLRLVK